MDCDEYAMNWRNEMSDEYYDDDADEEGDPQWRTPIRKERSY